VIEVNRTVITDGLGGPGSERRPAGLAQPDHTATWAALTEPTHVWPAFPRDVATALMPSRLSQLSWLAIPDMCPPAGRVWASLSVPVVALGHSLGVAVTQLW